MILPRFEIDPETRRQKERGIICKLCDRKFFIRDIVEKKEKDIEVQNQVIKI